jgi:hypothetical protein
MPNEFFKNHEHLMWRKINENENNVQCELQCLIFSTMCIQHDMDGEMTDEKLTEINRRLTLLKAFDALMTWTVSDDEYGVFERYSTNLESVVRYWGLETNVSHKSKTEWDKYFKKIMENSKRENDWQIAEAKRLGSLMDMTQPERQLKSLVDAVKAKKAKAEAAELTTPPPVS